MSLNPNSKLLFGKYKGISIDNIRLCDPQYIVWLHDKATLTGEIKKEVAACYDECVEAANRKNQTDPQRRKSAAQTFGPRIDFMGNYSDEDGAEIPNMGYMTNEEMDSHGHSMGGYDE